METNNIRIEGRPRREIFDVIISDLSTINRKNLLLTHFIWTICRDFFLYDENRDSSLILGNLSAGCVFKRRNEQDTCIVASGGSAEGQGFRAVRVSLFALVDALLENRQNLELLSRGKILRINIRHYGRIRMSFRETDEVYNEICKNENLAAVMEERRIFAEKLRRIIWSMTEEGKAQTEEEQEKISLAYVYDRSFGGLKRYLNSKSFSVF